jgi:hypothetical protein
MEQFGNKFSTAMQDKLIGETLPPQVEGALMGELQLDTSKFVWNIHGRAPDSVLISVKWWGGRRKGTELVPNFFVKSKHIHEKEQKREIDTFSTIARLVFFEG